MYHARRIGIRFGRIESLKSTSGSPRPLSRQNSVTNNNTHRQIAVIGGGISGICTAYFLAANGFEVAVIERRGNVAEEATFGNSGLLAPGLSMPLTLPGRFATFACRFKDEPRLLTSGTDFSRNRWMRQTRQQQQHKFTENKQRLTRLAAYGQTLTQQLQDHYAMEHENSSGVFHLFRTAKEAARMPQLREAAEHNERKFQALDAEAIRVIEPAFSSEAALSGAVYYPQDQAGNCVLFAKQMRNAAQAMGVTFHFASTVTGLQPEFGGRVALEIESPTLANRMLVDAVVVAAGMQTASLLQPHGMQLPLRALQSYSALVQVKNPDDAPSTALFDDSYKVAMVKLGSRIRITGLLSFLPPSQTLPPKALANLLKIAGEYYPNAANYNQAHFWSNTMALLPSGLPMFGPTLHNNVFVNIGHGPAGWASAVASSKVLADLMAGNDTGAEAEGFLPQDQLPAR